MGSSGELLLQLEGKTGIYWTALKPQSSLLRHRHQQWDVFEEGEMVNSTLCLAAPQLDSLQLGSGGAQPLVGHLQRVTCWDGLIKEDLAKPLAP